MRVAIRDRSCGGGSQPPGLTVKRAGPPCLIFSDARRWPRVQARLSFWGLRRISTLEESKRADRQEAQRPVGKGDGDLRSDSGCYSSTARKAGSLSRSDPT